MAKLFVHSYKKLITFPSLPGVFIEGVSRDLANEYLSYLSSKSHRSLLFDEEWLREAHHRCVLTIECMNQPNTYMSGPISREERHHLKDLRFAQTVLRGFLRLPVQRFPQIPTDILLEIMEWSTLYHLEPWSLTLVSLQIQRFLDPILFSTCVIGNNNFTDWCSDTCPRIRQNRHYVQNVTIKTFIEHHGFLTLSSVFPNIRRLSLMAFDETRPFTLTSIPTLTFLDCVDSEIGVLDFLGSLFVGLTTLSIRVTYRQGWGPWRWRWSYESLLHTTTLSYLWITASAKDVSRQEELLSIFEAVILPNLPPQAQFCAFRLIVMRLDPYLDPTYMDEPWDTDKLRTFANGSLSSRAVLLLASKPHIPISDIVIAPIKVENGCDRYRDQVLNVVRARGTSAMEVSPL
ncbi:hypothetical protein DL96DRAFT_1716881 [Flagelloscypha sp. PMI_526]|nr:hypothetical protein DL96DRAFT_1716881 [Flagelloscypha sp. PMI_526]